jgi:hypothetical protein
MKEHGVLYPTLYQGSYENLNEALLLRNQSGLPTDHLYVFSLETGNATDEANLTILQNKVSKYLSTAALYGFNEVYIYGMDEVSGSVLLSERPAWEAVHETGAKIFVAIGDHTDAVDLVGDLLDVAVLSYSPNTTQAAQWHSHGKRLFSYNNPQVGVENPEIYRKNYGVSLWLSGYDGAMVNAYQSTFGQSIWNDYDAPGWVDEGELYHYRDHVFAYPTSNGVIDTIQWEGWREGVDDTRYLAKLVKLKGSDESTRALVADSISKGQDMETIRKKIIERILISSNITKEQLKIDVFNDVWNLSKKFQFGKIARSQ